MTSKQTQHLPSNTDIISNDLQLQQNSNDADNKNTNDVTEELHSSPGEATLLVSEFPPPPYYYRLAGSGPGGGGLLPPPIPTEAISRGTRRAAAAAARAREAERRQRLAEQQLCSTEQLLGPDETDTILGGVVKDTKEQADEEGDVVAVFGEIVEDPLLVEPVDYCEDPYVVREEVKRLHRVVLRTFVHMVQDLVHRPLENKYVIFEGRVILLEMYLLFGSPHTKVSLSIFFFL
jgi:hypothetical protein